MTTVESLPFDQAWKIWVNCLKGDDINSIHQQITLMVWDTSIFRLILESRQLQFKKNPEDPAINRELHSFIDRNYFSSQTASIRRLCDKSYGITGKKSVYSVYTLIDDLLKHRQELTREALFKIKNMPIDYSDIPEKRNEFFRNNSSAEKAFWIPPELDWESIEEAHQLFDHLSGTQPNNRHLNDVISEKVFEKLKEKLDTCHEITIYVDKYIAHSATPESRESKKIGESKLTLRRIWDAQRIIFEVAEFLLMILFSEGHMALAIENPSFFQNWEIPFFEKNNIDLIRDSFENYRKETEKWNFTAIEDTWKWIEKDTTGRRDVSPTGIET